ncbi:unnamed protein product [Calypogeia fissa]
MPGRNGDDHYYSSDQLLQVGGKVGKLAPLAQRGRLFSSFVGVRCPERSAGVYPRSSNFSRRWSLRKVAGSSCTPSKSTRRKSLRFDKCPNEFGEDKRRSQRPIRMYGSMEAGSRIKPRLVVPGMTLDWWQ